MYADTLWEVLWPPFALDTWSFLTILSLLLLFTLLVNLELVIRSSEKLWNLLLQIPNLLESPITRIASLPWPLVNTAVYTFILMLLVALLSYGSFLSSLYLLIPFPSYLPHSLYLLIPFHSYLLPHSLLPSISFPFLSYFPHSLNLLFPFPSFDFPHSIYLLFPLSLFLPFLYPLLSLLYLPCSAFHFVSFVPLLSSSSLPPYLPFGFTISHWLPFIYFPFILLHSSLLQIFTQRDSHIYHDKDRK